MEGETLLVAIELLQECAHREGGRVEQIWRRVAWGSSKRSILQAPSFASALGVSRGARAEQKTAH